MPPAYPIQGAPKNPDGAQNEYIPAFIAKRPFYAVDEDGGDLADYLDHQKPQRINEESADKPGYERRKKLGPVATKFRKGACENCGALTHKTKDCLSRPRKQGAKWTGKNIQADESVQQNELSWDAKRDRWAGYDPKEYEKIVADFNVLEETRRRAKADEADSMRYEEEAEMGRDQSTAVRNLRIREDTAKYLLNLDMESAKYDPKTRSMTDSGITSDAAAVRAIEEGFMRMSGEAAEFEKAQQYAWNSAEQGGKQIHLQANPTSGEFMRKKELEASQKEKEDQKTALLAKYGDQTHVKMSTKIPVVESKRFVEYDERGAIKGLPKTIARSQYAEDVMINNHTSAWGSWWHQSAWGYACCHSKVKNSYCTGEQGKLALEQSVSQLRDTQDSRKQIILNEDAKDGESTQNGIDQHHIPKKRGYQSMRAGVSDAEMEEYRRKRVAPDDPMRDRLGRDELVL